MSTRGDNRPVIRHSRRQFLKVLSTSAAGTAVAGTLTSPGIHAARADQVLPEGRFGRMFRLPSFAEPSPQVEAALRELG